MKTELNLDLIENRISKEAYVLMSEYITSYTALINTGGFSDLRIKDKNNFKDTLLPHINIFKNLTEEIISLKKESEREIANHEIESIHFSILENLKLKTAINVLSTFQIIIKDLHTIRNKARNLKIDGVEDNIIFNNFIKKINDIDKNSDILDELTKLNIQLKDLNEIDYEDTIFFDSVLESNNTYEIGAPFENKIIKIEEILSKKPIEKIYEEIKLTSEEIFREAKTAKLNISNRLEDIKNQNQIIIERMLKKENELNEYINNKKLEVENEVSEVKKLLGIMNGNIIADEHSDYAKKEQKQANDFRKGAIISFIISAASAVYFLNNISDQISNEILAMRILTVFTLAIFGGYLSRESQKHRNQQYYYRKIDLDLKSINQYISSLDKTNQDAIKTDVASKIFGHKANVSKDSFPLDAQEIALEAIKSAKSHAKSKKSNAEAED